jgi:4'-phosphopantetheinyl transferase
LEFYNHPLGKPYLSGKYGQNGIRYNFSHSRNMALYALADGREIGVDLEFISYQADLDSIANKYYSPNEYNFLMSLPGDQIAQAFFTCWTCKEAYLKALGVGLALPTDQFEISLATSDSPQLVHVKGDPVEAGRWRLEVLSPAPGYTAALAAEGHDWHLSCWEYSPSLGLATFH